MKQTEFLKGKYIFVDFDGTLCEYRYNDHVSGKTADAESLTVGGQSLGENLFEDAFLKARPLLSMKKVLDEIGYEKVYILGVCISYNEIRQKKKWLKHNYPEICDERLFFVAGMDLKVETMLEFCKYHGLDKSELVFIDDTLPTLREAEESGITSYHITSFVE